MKISRPSTTSVTGPALSRRALLGSVVAASAAAAAPAYAFGDEGAFNPRILLAGTAKWAGQRKEAPARWALEVVGRTSAPARLSPTTVRADAPDLLEEPFAVWAGGRRP